MSPPLSPTVLNSVPLLSTTQSDDLSLPRDLSCPEMSCNVSFSLSLSPILSLSVMRAEAIPCHLPSKRQRGGDMVRFAAWPLAPPFLRAMADTAAAYLLKPTHHNKGEGLKLRPNHGQQSLHEVTHCKPLSSPAQRGCGPHLGFPRDPSNTVRGYSRQGVQPVPRR
jgi:hypothetical protein